jgi:hypothetical protein
MTSAWIETVAFVAALRRICCPEAGLRYLFEQSITETAAGEKKITRAASGNGLAAKTTNAVSRLNNKTTVPKMSG